MGDAQWRYFSSEGTKRGRTSMIGNVCSLERAERMKKISQ
jgi:hypothetical protein